MSHATPPNEGALRGRDTFLRFIILLLVLNVVSIAWGLDGGYIRYNDPWNQGYSNLVVGVMLLLHHLAFQNPGLGWKGKAMKAVAVAWVTLGTAYIFFTLVRP